LPPAPPRPKPPETLLGFLLMQFYSFSLLGKKQLRPHTKPGDRMHFGFFSFKALIAVKTLPSASPFPPRAELGYLGLMRHHNTEYSFPFALWDN